MEGASSLVEEEWRSLWAPTLERHVKERKKMIPIKKIFESKRNLLYSCESYKPTVLTKPKPKKVVCIFCATERFFNHL